MEPNPQRKPKNTKAQDPFEEPSAVRYYNLSVTALNLLYERCSDGTSISLTRLARAGIVLMNIANPPEIIDPTGSQDGPLQDQRGDPN